MEWNGKKLSTYGDIRTAMHEILTDADAATFMQLLREEYPDQAEAFVFYLSCFDSLKEQVVTLVQRFLHRDCSGTFFIVPTAANQYGNVAYFRCIMEVELGEEPPHRLFLRVLAPEKMATTWPTISPTASSYRIVEGPARLLTFAEWADITGFSPKGTNA